MTNASCTSERDSFRRGMVQAFAIVYEQKLSEGVVPYECLVRRGVSGAKFRILRTSAWKRPEKELVPFSVVAKNL